MKTLQLQVVTVAKALFEGEARQLHCRGVDGEMTILAHHEPLITHLVESTVRVTDADGEVHEYPIQSGILEVANNRAVVLCSGNV